MQYAIAVQKREIPAINRSLRGVGYFCMKLIIRLLFALPQVAGATCGYHIDDHFTVAQADIDYDPRYAFPD